MHIKERQAYASNNNTEQIQDGLLPPLGYLYFKVF